MRILFVIQAHSNLSQVACLLNLIRGKGHKYLVSADTTSEEYISFCREDHGAIIRRSLPITWLGYSQVQSWFDVLYYCLSLERWDVIINLSGYCLPLRPIGEIENALDVALSGSASVAIQSRGSAPWYGEGPSLYNGGIFNIDWQHAAARQASIHCKLGGRAETFLHPMLAGFFEDPTTSPLNVWHNRLSVMCDDVYGVKMLSVRPFDFFEALDLTDMFRDVDLRTGRAWFAMTRDFVEYMFRGRQMFEFAAKFRNSLCADELVLPTYLEMLGKKGAVRYLNHNFHVRGGDAIDVGPANYLEILESKELFVRKVNYETNRTLVDAVRRRL